MDLNKNYECSSIQTFKVFTAKCKGTFVNVGNYNFTIFRISQLWQFFFTESKCLKTISNIKRRQRNVSPLLSGLKITECGVCPHAGGPRGAGRKESGGITAADRETGKWPGEEKRTDRKVIQKSG